MIGLSLIAALSATQGPVAPDPLFNCATGMGELVGDAEVNERYAGRAADIVAAAVGGETGRLGSFLAPDAHFMARRGDTMNPGSGAACATWFFRNLHPARYETVWSLGGMLRVTPCGPQSAEMLTVSADAQDQYRVVFHFNGGLLVSAESDWIGTASGQLAAEVRS